MKQSFQQFSILASIAIFSVIMIASQGMLEPVYGAHAFDDFTAEYDFVAGIHNEVTFKFRNGVETVNFPVFSTTSDIVENIGTSFEVEGVIGYEAKGTNGFGYDPLFIVPELGKTFAQLESDEKNALSHRANALKLLKVELDKYLEA